MVSCRVAVGVAALLLSATMASAQTGSVAGRAVNSQGGVVPGAEASLRPLPAAGTMPNMPNMPNMPAPAPDRTATASADGTFTFNQVPTGEYVLQVDSPGFERASQALTISNQPQTLTMTLTPLDIPGGEAIVASTGVPDTQSLLERIKQLEQRLSDLESSTVLSEPETRVKRIEVYVDENKNVHDEPVPGAKKEVTYQRERVYRRQWLSEKLEQAFADQQAGKIAVRVSAASVTQFATKTKGSATDADGHAYQLASADLLFPQGWRSTSFFADVVGLSGAPPDAEIHGLTLLNSYRRVSCARTK